nr:LuxR family transcriptional regulator [Nocardioides jishulii]
MSRRGGWGACGAAAHGRHSPFLSAPDRGVAMDLVGRVAERAAIDELVARARSGHSGVLVVRGEAGIGKTLLMDHAGATASSSGFVLASSTGVEAERQFAFAGLHQLCGPLLGRLGALPEPQQTALGVAFGRHSGPAPDRFLVGLATLNLLAEVGEEAPLLCVVDDAQWLDEASAQVLAFVARRVSAERMALLFALRDSGPGDDHAFTGLPELRLEGLSDVESETLLDRVVATPLDDAVRARIAAEARGNPLALLELPRGASPARLAGGFGRPDELSVPRRIEEGFRRRSASLPIETRLLLLVAAAEPTGDSGVLWRAASRLGIPREAAAPAEASGLVEMGTRVRFRHPLVRSAIYQAGTAPDRRRAHGALASATDSLHDPDRRAWHRAQAVLGTDEETAAELERSADRARVRGGVAAAAAFLQRAAELTPEPSVRTRRALAAAHLKYDAGAPESALALLDVAEAGPLDALQAARVTLLRAQVAFHTTRGGEVPGLLVEAAQSLSSLDPRLSRETYLNALDAALVSGGSDRGLLEVAEAARLAPAPPGPPQPSDLLLDGLVTTLTCGSAEGTPELRHALSAFRDALTDPEQAEAGERWLRLACRNALAAFDDELLHILATHNVHVARDAGALAKLPDALRFLSLTLVLTGELDEAGGLATEASALTQATGGVQVEHAHLILSAWRGDQTKTTELRDVIAQDAAHPDGGTEESLAQYSLAVLHNGLGNYAAAHEAAARACESPEVSLSNLAHVELIEAAARAGQMERAAEAAAQVCSRARASGSPWALGIAARSDGLVSAGAAADEHFSEAIAQLGRSRMGGLLARTHLVYGEWLRREGRRRDARDQLRTAHQLLGDMGAGAFAARAARELRATGEHPRARTAQPVDELTAQERHVARLVASGATSREVAAQLFLSPRTIEAHLRNIFRKLEITSRRQLRELPLS